MNEKILIYESNEISNIVSKIVSNTTIIENDIKSSLNNDFFILQELDFFDTGLNSLKTYANKISNMNNNLISRINEHDSSMNELNNKHLALFNKDDVEIEKQEVYSGTVVEIDDIVLNKVTDAKVILSEYINEVIPSFSYDKKIEVLKNILNNDTSLSIITDKEESDIMVYQLKNILNNNYSIELSKLTKDEEQDIQKSFFKSIIDNDTNIFDELEGNSFLNGLSFFKQVSEKNGIEVSDLIFDDENNELFMDSINEIYNSEKLDVLTEEEMNSVKNYIKETANKNNINVSDLLSDSKYSSVIKGGIYYED